MTDHTDVEIEAMDEKLWDAWFGHMHDIEREAWPKAWTQVATTTALDKEQWTKFTDGFRAMARVALEGRG